MRTNSKRFLPQVLMLGLVSLTQSCGETVNFEVEEQLTPEAAADAAAKRNGNGTTGGDASTNPGGTGGATTTDSSTGGVEIGKDGLPVACHSPKVITRNDALTFPEIPAGTTCTFGSGENLSRLNGKIRAYLKQTQEVSLPEGATLCGFSLDHEGSAMRYDDEMFFSVNNRLLLATENYTKYFKESGGFHSFSWEGLVNQNYTPSDGTNVYCAGGAQGLSTCSVPATETSGRISLTFNETMEANLARSLQKDRKLTFDWITTGDNDDSDCRHTAINLKLNLRYVMP